MKKLLYVLLAMFIAFAMTGCPAGDDDDGGPTPNPNPNPGPGPSGPVILPTKPAASPTAPAITATQDGDTIRLVYVNGNYIDIPYLSGETTWADITKPAWGLNKDGQDDYYKPDQLTDDNRFYYTFGGWEDADRQWSSATVGTATIDEDLTLTAVWWSTELTATASDDAEKVRSENGAPVIYEFEVGAGFDLATITGISVSYKVSDATLKRKPETRFRAYGPYFFNGTTPIVPDDTTFPSVVGGAKDKNFWGDFLVDDKGAYVARFEGSGQANQTLLAFNKFHPYMILNGGTFQTWTTSAMTSGAISATISGSSGDIVADTWFDVQYTLNATGTGDYLLGQGLANLTASNDAHLPAGTSKAKVYFGLGMSVHNQDGTSLMYMPDPYDPGLGMIQLIKDVKLITTTTGKESIKGVRPTFTTADGTSDQVFGGYVSPRAFNWRGAVNHVVQIPQNDNTTPPNPPTKPDPNKVDKDVSIVGHTYGSTSNTAGDVRLVMTGTGATTTLVITMGELDFNSSNTKTVNHNAASPATTGDLLYVQNAWFGMSEADIKTAIEWETGDEFDIADYQVAVEYVLSNSAAAGDAAKGIWGGGGIWFDLPTDYADYTTIKIDYTSTGVMPGYSASDSSTVGTSTIFFVVDTEDGDFVDGNVSTYKFIPAPLPNAKNGLQVQPKNNANSFSNPSGGAKYWNPAATGSWTLPTAELAANATGISLQVNSWNHENTPNAGTITFTKITLIP